jgi:hypothetical protein
MQIHAAVLDGRPGRRCRVTLAAALLVMLAGCGPSRGVIPVTGIAKLEDGTPLARGHVFLTGGGENGARGQIQPDGTFRLGTFTATDGAKPGTYTAYILGATEEDTRSYDEKLNQTKPAPPSLVDKKYDAAATSDLRVEIKPPKTRLELVLEPNTAPSKSPFKR